MPPLEALPLHELVRDAAALAQGLTPPPPGPPSADEAEVARVLQICNACRYCEGFCAVFPAMTRRLEFGSADVHFIANLCHGCGACLHACQYAPPHEFMLNVPRAMARVRRNTWSQYAWPRAFGAAYQRNGLVLALALMLGVALFLALALQAQGTLWQAVPGGNFYALFPHGLLVGLFTPVFAFALLALGIGVRRFWRAAPPGPASAAAAAEATQDALSLKYLGGGHGQGCNEADDAFSLARRRAHHATFYGFLLCFAATAVGTLYHYVFGWQAPHAWTSLPKLLGSAGGVLLVIGCVGLWRLNLKRHALHAVPEHAAMDRGFIALLLATGASGLLLALLRATPALGPMLALHLGAVLALFATLPYSKFAHGAYRAAALGLWAIEKRQPSRLQLGED